MRFRSAIFESISHLQKKYAGVQARLCFVFAVLLGCDSLLLADDDPLPAELMIKPSRCVALHQGQVCYQNIKISWQSEVAGDYCIYWALSKEPLKCWIAQREGVLKYDFQSSKTVVFSLRSMQPVTSEINSEMRVAWVHKARKRKRLNWRLF